MDLHSQRWREWLHNAGHDRLLLGQPQCLLTHLTPRHLLLVVVCDFRAVPSRLFVDDVDLVGRWMLVCDRHVGALERRPLTLQGLQLHGRVYAAHFDARASVVHFGLPLGQGHHWFARLCDLDHLHAFHHRWLLQRYQRLVDVCSKSHALLLRKLHRPGLYLVAAWGRGVVLVGGLDVALGGLLVLLRVAAIGGMRTSVGRQGELAGHLGTYPRRLRPTCHCLILHLALEEQ